MQKAAPLRFRCTSKPVLRNAIDTKAAQANRNLPRWTEGILCCTSAVPHCGLATECPSSWTAQTCSLLLLGCGLDGAAWLLPTPTFVQWDSRSVLPCYP